MATLDPTAGQSATELQRQIHAENIGDPFLVYRDGNGEQLIVPLAARARVTIGRSEDSELDLDFDEEVSRVHAQLERVGDEWALSDDGLSRNGTFVNRTRVARRQRLRDRDLLRVGRTGILFRAPVGGDAPIPTRTASEGEAARHVTEAQRRVLVALCRPFKGGSEFATPATNREIAAELHLSVDAVKGHLRILFDRYGLGDLAPNKKRVRLAELAIREGAISPSDLD